MSKYPDFIHRLFPEHSVSLYVKHAGQGKKGRAVSTFRIMSNSPLHSWLEDRGYFLTGPRGFARAQIDLAARRLMRDGMEEDEAYEYIKEHPEEFVALHPYDFDGDGDLDDEDRKIMEEIEKGIEAQLKGIHRAEEAERRLLEKHAE